MSVHLDERWILALILIATRLGGVFLAAPVLGFPGLPVQVRVLFVIALSLVLISVPGVLPTSADWSVGIAAFAIASELLLGVMLGFGLQVAFAAFNFGGALADLQIGFGAATLFDPATRVQSPLFASFLTTVGGVVFLGLDAHHELIRGIRESMRLVPLGHAALSDSNLVGVISEYGLVFVYGFVIVSPVVLGLMLVDVAVAVIARTMPQINVYFVALPLKVFLGLFLLALSLVYLGPTFRQIFSMVFVSWPSSNG